MTNDLTHFLAAIGRSMSSTIGVGSLEELPGSGGGLEHASWWGARGSSIVAVFFVFENTP